MRPLLPFIIACICWPCLGHAQNNPVSTLDSLRSALSHAKGKPDQALLHSKIAMELAESKPDSALLLASKGEKLATDAADEEDDASCLNAKGWVYYRLGETDSAIFYLTRAATIFHKLHDQENESSSLTNLATVYESEDNHEKALAYLLPALQISTKQNDLRVKGYNEKLIGSIYRKQAEYDKAESYLRSSIATFRQLHNEALLADAVQGLAIMYYSMHKYDSALTNYYTALNLFKKTNRLPGVAYANEDIGDLFFEKGKASHQRPLIDSALQHYLLALDLFKYNQSDQAFEKLNISRVQGFLKQYDAAIVNLKEAIGIFQADKLFNYAYDASNQLSSIYKEKKDFKNALAYLEMSNIYKDSTDIAKQKQVAANLLAKYEADKKDKAIQLLNAQNALSEKELSKKRTLEIASLIFVVLIALLVGLLWNQYRIRQRLKELRIRNQIAQDLHDEVGSTLSGINLFSKIALKNFEGNDPEKSLELMKRIAQRSAVMVDAMGDIVWSVNPGSDHMDSIVLRMKSHAAEMLEPQNIDIRFTVQPEVLKIKFSPSVRKDFYLIYKEAINNMAKYAACSLATIELEVQQDVLSLCISDNGIGFDAEQAQQGNGIKNMHTRARNIKGKLIITSRIAEGARLFLQWPLPRNGAARQANK